MQFGDYRVEIIPDTEFRLDGGAMFGVVPRNLWAKVCPPDEENRIRMNMNCVFIDTGNERILIETGIGEKWSAKHTAMFGIDREATASLNRCAQLPALSPDSISIVINTHLHFDHAGGNTKLNGLTRRSGIPECALLHFAELRSITQRLPANEIARVICRRTGGR